MALLSQAQYKRAVEAKEAGDTELLKEIMEEDLDTGYIDVEVEEKPKKQVRKAKTTQTKGD